MSYHTIKEIIFINNKIYLNTECNNDDEPYKTWEWPGTIIDIILYLQSRELQLSYGPEKHDNINAFIKQLNEDLKEKNISYHRRKYDLLESQKKKKYDQTAQKILNLYPNYLNK